MTQFSLFGSEAVPAALADLDGLLLAGGQWVRSGPGARLSVVVADTWRAELLAAAFAERDVAGTDTIVTAPTGYGVRTAFTATLREHAATWVKGANLAVPPGFQLGAGGLRLWAVAAGHRDEVGFLLRSTDPEQVLHRVAGAQLARLGVAAVSLAQRPGPGWRITSARRLRRLEELVGPAPAGCGRDWPVSAGHGPTSGTR